MANKLYEESSVQAIADAIREKNGSSDTYTIGQMAAAVSNLPSGGGVRTCRVVVGTSTAGWTEADCDYLCDGTNDEVEIQAAIDDVEAAGGGELRILNGNYNVSSYNEKVPGVSYEFPCAISVPANIAITGEEGTVISCKSPGTIGSQQCVVGIYNSSIDGIEFVISSMISGEYVYTIIGTGAEVKNCTFTENQYAIESGDNTTVYNCNFVNCGIAIEPTNNDVIIHNRFFCDSKPHSVAPYAKFITVLGNSVSVKDNTFESSIASGCWAIMFPPNPITSMLDVIGNRFLFSGSTNTKALYITGTQDKISFINNNVSGAGNSVQVIQSASLLNSLIVNNIMNVNVDLAGTTTGTIVDNNVIA